jgi:[acyl-carrier-protein] S-malonyltransferase
MQPAADAMAAALANVQIKAPAVPVIANVTANPLSETTEIIKRLVEQVTGTVRWRECMAAMADNGVNLFCELGAGKVLTGLVKRNAPIAKGIAAGAPDELDAAAAQIKQG